MVSFLFTGRYFYLHCEYHNDRHFLEKTLRSQESCLPPHQSGARWHPRWPRSDINRRNCRYRDEVFSLWNWSQSRHCTPFPWLFCFHLLSGCDRCWKSICDQQTHEAPNRSHCVLLAWALACLDHCCTDHRYNEHQVCLPATWFGWALVRSSGCISRSSVFRLPLLLLYIVGHIKTIASARTEGPAEQKTSQYLIHSDVLFTGHRTSRRNSNHNSEGRDGLDQYRWFLHFSTIAVFKLFDKPVRVRPEDARVPTRIQTTLRGFDRELAAEPGRSDTNGGRGSSCGDSEVSGDPREANLCSAYGHIHWSGRKLVFWLVGLRFSLATTDAAHFRRWAIYIYYSPLRRNKTQWYFRKKWLF